MCSNYPRFVAFDELVAGTSGSRTSQCRPVKMEVSWRAWSGNSLLLYAIFFKKIKLIIYSREILKLYLPEGGVNHQGFGFTEPKAR